MKLIKLTQKDIIEIMNNHINSRVAFFQRFNRI